MGLTTSEKNLLNNATPGLAKAKLGDKVDAISNVATTTAPGLVLKGAAVVDATDAASAITQLNALLASLRASGAIA